MYVNHGAKVSAAATATGVDPRALEQLYRQEAVRLPSGAFATSPAGARGPMQVMPDTFAGVARQYGIVGGIDDIAANVLAGAYYYRDLVKQFAAQGYGPDIAAGAYNMGPGRLGGTTGMFGVLAGQRNLPDETARYIRNFQTGFGSEGGLLGPGSMAAPASAQQVFTPTISPRTARVRKVPEPAPAAPARRVEEERVMTRSGEGKVDFKPATSLPCNYGFAPGVAASIFCMRSISVR